MSLIKFNAAQQVLAQLGNQFPATQGRLIFCRPATGGDGNNGSTPAKAVKTLVQALALATADQNDIVVLMAESDTAATASDLQAATLNWNKNGVHLIGIHAGGFIGQRARIAFATAYATASNLFTLSANGCLISGIEFVSGVASALPTGCFSLTGARNRIRNCTFNGFGNAAQDIAGAYSVKLTGAIDNFFEDCTIGQDALQLGAAANSEILCATAASKNWFKRCKVLCNTTHATNHIFLRAPTTSLLRYLIFEDVHFLNAIDDTTASTALTSAFVIASDAGGTVLLLGSTGQLGATDWNSTDSGNVRSTGGTVTAATYGLAVAILR